MSALRRVPNAIAWEEWPVNQGGCYAATLRPSHLLLKCFKYSDFEVQSRLLETSNIIPFLHSGRAASARSNALDVPAVTMANLSITAMRKQLWPHLSSNSDICARHFPTLTNKPPLMFASFQ